MDTALRPAPESNVTGLHVFTFNQVRQAEQWRQALLAKYADVAPASPPTAQPATGP